TVTILFVGGAQGDADSPTLEQLRARLEAADAERTVVTFTGNYTHGSLPAEGAPGRDAAVAALQAHVDATAAFARRGGKVYFLAGQDDFPEGQTATVRRLREFLNTAFARE